MMTQRKKSKVLIIYPTSADNEEDAKLLDRIYKVLNGGQIGQNIRKCVHVH